MDSISYKRSTNYIKQVVGYKDGKYPFQDCCMPVVDVKKLMFYPELQDRCLSVYRHDFYIRPFARRYIGVNRFQTFECTCLVSDLKEDNIFKDTFFSKRYRKIMQDKHLEIFNKRNVPERMGEIVGIAEGRWKRRRTIQINFTTNNYQEDHFFWFLISFLKGEVSATKGWMPYDYKMLSDEAKGRVLNTIIQIITFIDPKDTKLPEKWHLIELE